MNASVERFTDRDEVLVEQVVWEVTADELKQIESREIQGGVVVAVLNDDGAILLIGNEWMDGYGLPGGGVEYDETWEEAAVREVREETGVSIEVVRP